MFWEAALEGFGSICCCLSIKDDRVPNDNSSVMIVQVSVFSFFVKG